jgi:hypothetical protein
MDQKADSPPYTNPAATERNRACQAIWCRALDHQATLGQGLGSTRNGTSEAAQGEGRCTGSRTSRRASQCTSRAAT